MATEKPADSLGKAEREAREARRRQGEAQDRVEATLEQAERLEEKGKRLAEEGEEIRRKAAEPIGFPPPPPKDAGKTETPHPDRTYKSEPTVIVLGRTERQGDGPHVEDGPMDSVVHFEMPYENCDRMAKFYQSAFGWQTQMMGQDMGNYVVATTTETGDTGPKKPGAINGGFYAKMPDQPMQYPSLVIAVDDVKKSMGKVTTAGGKVLGAPMEIPGVGHYVSFVDPEGNRVSILQPFPRTGQAPK